MKSINGRKSRIVALVGLVAWLGPLCVLADNIYVSFGQAGTVQVIDSSGHSLVTTLSVVRPKGVAVSPDGTRLYVLEGGTSFCNDDGVRIFDTSTFALVGHVLIASCTDTDLVVSPDGASLYAITNIGGTYGATVIDTSAEAIVDHIVLGGAPRAIDISPDGATLLVANQSSDVVHVIDTSTGTVTGNIPILADISGTGIGFSPDGTKSYMADNITDEVFELDHANLLVVRSLFLNRNPGPVKVSSDGARVYVGIIGGTGPKVVDAVSFTVTKGLPVSGIRDMAFSTDGTRLYMVTLSTSEGLGIMNTVLDSFAGRLPAYRGNHVAVGTSDFDTDNDGIANSEDNCPDTANADQTDTNGDGEGDACDDDDDGDGVLDGTDNCPLEVNPGQGDFDMDGAGDPCDSDDDGDDVLDAIDACLLTPAAAITNADGCAIADLCPCIHPDGSDKWKNHGKYTSCVARAANDFRDAGLISDSEHGDIVSEAGQSACGVKN